MNLPAMEGEFITTITIGYLYLKRTKYKRKAIRMEIDIDVKKIQRIRTFESTENIWNI